MSQVLFQTHADYQKYNFFRTPDWRWSRVLSLVDRAGETPGRCTRRDDDIVRTARNYVLRWRNGDVEKRSALVYEYPGLHFAYDFNERAMDDPDVTMYIQARLLARQTPEQIGDVMGILPDAVVWYSKLFFDVMPYLDQRDWITKQILVPAMLKSPSTPQEDGLPTFKDSTIATPFLDGSLKLFAYFGGTHLVDLMIHGMESGKPLVSRDDVAAWFDNTITTTVRRRTAQAAQLFEINKYNVLELFAVHTRIMEIEKSDASQDQAKTGLERHIHDMIGEIPWAIGDDGEKMYTGTALGTRDTEAAELRDDEILLVGSGRETPQNSSEVLKALPPPRKATVAAVSSTVTLS